MNRLSTIENSIFNLNEKLRKEQRTKELLSWAKHDYGIDMTSSVRNDFRKKGNKSKLEIVNECDFIFKVKQKYIKKKNNEAARKIQSILKGRLQRMRFIKERDITRYCVTKIQCYIRMKQQRARYMRMLAYLYF